MPAHHSRDGQRRAFGDHHQAGASSGGLVAAVGGARGHVVCRHDAGYGACVRGPFYARSIAFGLVRSALILLDTHVLVWAVDGDRRLGENAAAAIEQARRTDRIGISAITPWEIALLAERGRLRLAQDVGEWMDAALSAPGLDVLPIEPAIAVASVRLPGEFHADPADRLIVATARHWRTPLATADRAIAAYASSGHLRVIDATR